MTILLEILPKTNCIKPKFCLASRSVPENVVNFSSTGPWPRCSNRWEEKSSRKNLLMQRKPTEEITTPNGWNRIQTNTNLNNDRQNRQWILKWNKTKIEFERQSNGISKVWSLKLKHFWHLMPIDFIANFIKQKCAMIRLFNFYINVRWFEFRAWRLFF